MLIMHYQCNAPKTTKQCEWCYEEKLLREKKGLRVMSRVLIVLLARRKTTLLLQNQVCGSSANGFQRSCATVLLYLAGNTFGTAELLTRLETTSCETEDNAAA